jgi:hypothetical protein
MQDGIQLTLEVGVKLVGVGRGHPQRADPVGTQVGLRGRVKRQGAIAIQNVTPTHDDVQADRHDRIALQTAQLNRHEPVGIAGWCHVVTHAS